MAPTLSELARDILLCADPAEKAAMAQSVAVRWRLGDIAAVGLPCAPVSPAYADRPILMLPKDMPRRRASGQLQNRVALLHAVAHIELNAINLAWDIICRFASPDIPDQFFEDWVRVGDEEAKHFLLVQKRLEELGTTYGDMLAHDGLWQAAKTTSHDLMARLAIVPLVFEARGLDVTPAMIAKLQRAGDMQSAACLQIIYDDEIGHVAIGKTWFDWCCCQNKLEPISTWKTLVAQHFAGKLKPPFNEAARTQANFPPDYYLMESEDGNEYEQTAQHNA
ncbi:MAG: ferritin-like domain-containing protein [Alphaproteobacteria bacterium]|nr:MAG: ferritin-like domain-containing protein [Alphaproteobacteria bacterium]